jgi:serine/threonine protein kinase
MNDIGPYKPIKQINEGGFGTIWQVEHKTLEELACAKINRNRTQLDAELLKMEAKLLWRLSDYHSIPSTKDLIKVDENQYALIMNYIEGQALGKLVEEKGPLHPEDASWIIERLLGAVNYINYNGIVHCDIKPENVIVEAKKRDIKLIDFGLSSYMPKHLTTPIGYTPRYAAPELMQGKPPLPETDLYGVGITMLYALGGNVETKSLPAGVPGALKDFCEQLIRYDPLQRPRWEKEDIIARLSDIREKAFGRRHAY